MTSHATGTRSTRAARTTAVAVLAASMAVSLAACSSGEQVPFLTATGTPTPTTATRSIGPLRVAVVPATRQVAGVSVTSVDVTVDGGGPSVAARIRRSANTVVESLVDDFAARATASGLPADRTSATVTATTQRWKGYVTLRATARTRVGTTRTATSVAFLWSAGSGKRITAGDLFSDPAAASAVVRRRLLATRPAASAAKAARLSVRPDANGRTAPLSCVPVEAGLQCAVDAGAVAPVSAGLLTVTVPWKDLSPLLRPDLEA